MVAKEYAKKLYGGLPTYQKIAEDAFKAGANNSKPKDVVKLEKELKQLKDELRSLWKTLEDPEECGRLLAGM